MKFQPKTDWKYDDTPTEADFNRIEQGIEDSYKGVQQNSQGILEAKEQIESVEQQTEAHSSDYVKHQGFGITTGENNNYSLNLSPSPNAYVDGMCIVIAVHLNSNGGSTLNINGLGSKPLKRSDGSEVTDLKQNGIYTFRYNTATGAFVLQGEGMKIHGNEFHAEPYMPISGGDFTGQITVNGKPVGIDDVDADPLDITYFVRLNGNDNNDGKSEATAFRTLGKAMSMWKTVTTGGKRTFNIGAGVNLTTDLTDINRTWKVNNKFGGDFLFEFNNAHAFCFHFENIQARFRIQNFERYNSGVLVNNAYGGYCNVNNCMYVDISGMKCDQTGKISSYAGVEFNRSQGRVGESVYTQLGVWAITAHSNSNVYVWMTTGTVNSSYIVPYFATGGSIMSVYAGAITGAAIIKEESDGGLIIGV